MDRVDYARAVLEHKLTHERKWLVSAREEYELAREEWRITRGMRHSAISSLEQALSRLAKEDV